MQKNGWVLFLIATSVIGLAIALGYQTSWTGFDDAVYLDGSIRPYKTLWDWLDLVLIPAFLAFAAWLLESSRKRSEKKTEQDRQRQQTLDAYFDAMTKLLIDSDLGREQEADGASPDFSPR